MLAHIHWDFDPVIFELGPIALRWYGVFFAAGFLIGYSIMQRIYRREGKPEKDLDSLCVALVLGTIVGARLGHCLFYEWDEYKDNLLEILMVWKGGLASHGGVAGNLIALWIYQRKRKDQPYLWLLDRVAIPTALTAGLIRIGNFFNSEILGTPTDKPWGIVFGNDTVARHPAMLYESFAYFAIFGLLAWLYRRRRAATPHGFLIGWFMVTVFVARFVIEFWKKAQKAGMEDSALSMGQWLSIPAILFGVWLVWTSRKRVPQA